MAVPDRRLRASGRTEGGFVLVIVLVLLVVLTLLASAVAASGSAAVARAQHEIDLFESDLDMLSTRETVLFMMNTQVRNLAGLAVDHQAPFTHAMLDDDTDGLLLMPTGSEIRLDATAYGGLGNAQFALQDDRGLLSLNWIEDFLRQAFYASHDMDFEQWDALDAKRLDYQDPDSLHRLNGAEAEHYVSAGLPPPTNRALATPLEYRRILQWNEMLADTSDASLLNTLTMVRNTLINPNTAPVEVLEMLPGMNREHAERLVAMRQVLPFTSLAQLREAFPLAPILNESLALFPNNSGNLILWDRRFGVRRLVHWTLTPMEIGGPPWRIDYEVILPRDNRIGETVVETPATPLFATQGPAGE